MPVELKDVRLDGRTPPTVTSRDTARITWTVNQSDAPVLGALVLQGASTRQRLEDGELDVWNIPGIDAGACAVTVANASSRRVHWRLAYVDAEGEHFTEVHVARRHSPWAPAWITHPDWSEREAADTGARAFLTQIEFDPAHDEAVELDIATPGVAWASINGLPLPQRLAPGYAQYKSEIPAVSIDLTPYLRVGENQIAIELAPGMSWITQSVDRYSKLTNHSALLRLATRIHHHQLDGLSQVHTPIWTTGRTSATATHWYGGEDHDLTIAPKAVQMVAAVQVEDTRPIWWPEHPPAEVTETLNPLSVTRTDNGSELIDFGTNIAGTPRLRTSTAQQLVIRPGELLSDSGHVTQWSTGSPIFHRLTTPDETTNWTPKFSYNGFRYIEVEGAPAGSCTWTAEVVRVANKRVGLFRSSDPFLDRLHQLVDRAVQGNMHSVFTDCPHREKLGWLEQLHLCFGALARNYDVEAHLRDSLHHIRAAQLESGAIPNIAPEFIDFTGLPFRGDHNAFREDPNWGGALVRTTWSHYRCYGDPRVLEENLGAIESYLAYLATRASEGLLNFGLGDWVGLEHDTSRALVASWGYARILEDAASIYASVGKHSLAADLRAQRTQTIGKLIAAHPLGRHSTQAEIALFADLHTSPSSALLDALQARIATDGRLTVGEIALPALIRLFAAHHADDTLYSLISRRDSPGYGFQIASGATALTETWTMAGGDEGEGSQNHFMLGMIDDWLHERVGGLRQESDDIGWKKVVIEPRMLTGVRSAQTSYRSAQGHYAVHWDLDEGILRIGIPVGASARLQLPSAWAAPSRLGPGHHVFHRAP
ncbi:family 78 glycoside hydrolase catalytic domain [Microbacterium sp.]|uniref:family 78 glycoside hydrolase catalytic domain n=1 Tax=Microbacterium sp. TaxID=51671 RepID=UPI003F6F3827